MAELKNKSAAVTEVIDALNRASLDGHFMVAVWYAADGKLNLSRITHNFPTADLLGALALLRRNLEDESLDKKPPPLPLASFVGEEEEVPPPIAENIIPDVAAKAPDPAPHTPILPMGPRGDKL
ncbi:MAG: hypothetical protein Q9M27_03005 [Mariprofundaceae bacterium]|nr:hypothetical protein [Mariprofundaceae bacterium]